MHPASQPRLISPQTCAGAMISPEDAGTLFGLFCERVRRSPDAIAYRDYDRAAGCWRAHSWRAIAARVDQMRRALAQDGLTPGDRVAVLAPNSIDWIAFDMAAQGQGLVVVALFPHDSVVDHSFILAHSDARLALVDKWVRWDSLRREAAQFPRLARVWIREAVRDERTGTEDARLRYLPDILAERCAPPPAEAPPPSALATLVYTSGTTGKPKGVMLSHAALLRNAAAVGTIIPPDRDDVFLSILPLAHSFERTVGCYLAMMGGASVAFVRSSQSLSDDMKALHPTVLLGVPRLFERVRGVICAKADAQRIGSALLRLFARLGWRRFESHQKAGSRPSIGERIVLSILDRWIGAPLRARFGGRLRVAVSGGAPLDPATARFLIGLGLPLVEGYGLTEAGPVVTGTRVDDMAPGSVGRPLAGIEVKLGAEDELLVRSPSLMLGYWKNEAATARKIDASGWLATGDIAAIENGRIYLRGRLKDIIVLSIGEKIDPNRIEEEMTRDALFHQVAVIGDGRPFLVALVVLDPNAWDEFAKSNQLDPRSPNVAAVKELILARLASRATHFPRYAQIRALHLMLEAWTIEAGLLTPTLKIRRHALEKRFAQDIEALYAPYRVRGPS